jgi:hypothetical protein
MPGVSANAIVRLSEHPLSLRRYRRRQGAPGLFGWDWGNRCTNARMAAQAVWRKEEYRLRHDGARTLRPRVCGHREAGGIGDDAE